MGCKKPKVMVVDDEKTVCNLLFHELSERGYLCTTALDGDKALAMLAATDFDVVLLDIKLPRMSGMRVLRKLRSNYPKTAAIMLTAVNEVDTVVEAMKLGASDYIVKPFSLDRLYASVHTVLELKKRSAGQRERETSHSTNGTKEDNRAAGEFFKQIDAIARGVEAGYDMLIGYSHIVTERTVEIARQLDIPEEQIQRWVADRTMRDSEKHRAIRTSLDKLRRSSAAQYVLGMTELHLYEPNLGEDHN